MNQPVTHYTDGRSAWRIGVTGFGVRWRGIASAIIIPLLTMGVLPWWWPMDFYLNIEIDLRYIALTFGASIACGLFYLRRRTKRSLDTKYYLHRFAHDIRDAQSKLHERLAPNQEYSKNQITEDLKNLLSQVCENIAHHFRLLTVDETIGVAIRLAVSVTVPDNKESAVVYKTYARSSYLSPQRENTSEPISKDQGIPRFLIENKNAHGVLFYWDLSKSAELGVYQLTKNDRLFHEIKTMMIAPLNAWTGGKESMIGILSITSAKNKTFSVKHTDSVAFVADFTAAAVASSFELVRLKCDNQ